MPRFTQIFGRLGNKTTDIKFFKDIIPLDVETVVEPFCGCCALSIHLFHDHNKYKYHFNDTDARLIDVIKDPEGYIAFKKDIQCQYKSFLSDNNTTKLTTAKSLEWKQRVESIDNKFTYFFTHEKFIRGNLFKDSNININGNDLVIFKKAKITCDDYKKVFELYKDDDKAFLFLDPPYLFSNNSTYYSQSEETDMTDIIITILEYLKVAQCKVMLIINDLKILRYMFKDYIKGDYNRIYQIAKKSSRHLIITNY
jgi:site-specific DNA-adenine methylase